MNTLRYKAVFFDLDDTLFDHQARRRAALGATRLAAGLPAEIDVVSMEAVHDRHQQRAHGLFLAGQLTLEQARVEGLRAALAEFGAHPDDGQLRSIEAAYRTAYEREWGMVPGSLELLGQLRTAGAWLGVITNGRARDQHPKLERLGLKSRFDDILISEELGCEKPSNEFFAHATRRAGVETRECIMVGDLWSTDIVGAIRSGMSAIWLNRYGRRPETEGSAVEITSFVPLEAVLRHFLIA